jgi:hypothetical protein
VTFGPDDVPHWLALEPGGDRIAITGYRGLESRAMMARIDRASGALRLDTAATLDFGRDEWPHGKTGKAIPHGAVFSRP